MRGTCLSHDATLISRPLSLLNNAAAFVQSGGNNSSSSVHCQWRKNGRHVLLFLLPRLTYPASHERDADDDDDDLEVIGQLASSSSVFVAVVVKVTALRFAKSSLSDVGGAGKRQMRCASKPLWRSSASGGRRERDGVGGGGGLDDQQ